MGLKRLKVDRETTKNKYFWIYTQEKKNKSMSVSPFYNNTKSGLLSTTWLHYLFIIFYLKKLFSARPSGTQDVFGII